MPITQRLAAMALALLVGACGGVPPDATTATPVPAATAASRAPAIALASPVPPGVAAPAASPPAARPVSAPRTTAMTAKVPVLMYHSVGYPKAGDPFKDLWVTPDELDAQLAALRAKDWSAITAAELGAAMQAGAKVPARTFVITFDDGRPGNATLAAPILARYGDRATFYVPAGLVGVEKDRITWDQAADLARAGNEIANHTMTHRSLAGAPTPATLETEITKAARRIETELAARGVTTTVTTFAYPYGATSPDAVGRLAREGYTVAFTTAPGKALIGKGTPLLTPRVRVSYGETLAAFLRSMGA